MGKPIAVFQGRTSSDNPHAVVKGVDTFGTKDLKTGTLHTDGQRYEDAVDHASKCSGHPGTKKS